MTKQAVKRTASSVSEMIRSVSDDSTFVDEFQQHIANRRIVHFLFGLRSARGMSQRQIAEKLGCSQSRISKLENSEDGDVRLGDLDQYAEALGLDVTLVLAKQRRTPVDEVKYHAFCIKRLLDHLCSLAKDDDAIAKAVAQFHGEAFFNLVRILQESAGKLPPGPDGKSRYIEIEFAEVDQDDCVDDSTPSPYSSEPVLH